MQCSFLRLVFLIAVGFSSILPSRAQVLKGVVVDKLTAQPLLEAQVAILNSPFSSITNYQGEFWIEPIQEEWVRIEISRHGFERKELDIKVNPSDTTEVEIHLLPAVATLNEGVVITAHRYAREAIRTASSISRMGREKFRQYNPRSVPEAMMGTPGIWLQESDPAISNLYLRGLTGNRTLLMIDGIRVNQAAFGTGNQSLLNSIDPFSVDQIEIIRGGASTQFGTDAMGGVAQIFTRTPGFSGKGVQAHGGGTLRYLGQGLERSVHGEFQINSPVVAFHAGMSLRDFGDRVGGGDRQAIPGTNYQERGADMKALVKISPRQLLTLAYQSMRQEEIHHYEKLNFFNYKTYQIHPRERELAYARYAAFTDNDWFREIVLTGSFQQLAQFSEKEEIGADFKERETNQMDTWGGNLEIHSQPGLYWKAVSGIDYYHDLLHATGRTVIFGSK
jgi:hemoglobin/transferrin/lactoferrin receptor protein